MKYIMLYIMPLLLMKYVMQQYIMPLLLMQYIIPLTIGFLSTRVSESTEQDLGKLKRLLEYIKGTVDMAGCERGSTPPMPSIRTCAATPGV